MILITGSTGFIGRHLTRMLLRLNLPVRLLLQQGEDIDRIGQGVEPDEWAAMQARIEIVAGDILDEESTYRAVTGVSTIIHLLSAQWWGRPRDLDRIDVSGTRNLIVQARSARVGRIIYISQIGASVSSGFILHRIKGEVEAMLHKSGLAYTIIRPGIVYGEDDSFINHIAMSLATNPLFYLMPGQGEVALHPIYIDDLTDALIGALENTDVVDRTIEIGGPEYMPFDDMMYTIMRVTGMQRALIPVPPYLLRLLVSLYRRVFRRTLMTSQWLDILAAGRTTQLGNTFQHFGLRPQRFEDTLLTYMPDRPYRRQAFAYVFRRRHRR